MASGNYFFDDGKSRKFWSYSLQGKKQAIRYGRLGTSGTETVKTFPSPAAAEAATAKLVNEKLGKGYIEVDPGKLKFTRDKKKWKRPATLAEVASLEKKLRTKLPAEYKQFLLTQNGGFPENASLEIPSRSEEDSVTVGEIYGLYDEPIGFTVLWALDKIQPRLPAGHLPISGWIDFCSMSLDKNPGCIYYWDEFAAPSKRRDAAGEPIFTSAHAVLVAGSFNEFLTRLANSKDPYADDEDDEEEADKPAVKSASKGRGKQKSSSPKLEDQFRDQLLPKEATQLTQRRQAELLRLAYEGGADLTAAYDQSEKAGDKFRREVHREIMQFLKETTNKHELQFFADNWHWDSGSKPLLELAKHSHVDAGTLLQIFWNGSAEDYYLFHRAAADIDDEFERAVFQVFLQIERRFVKGDIKTSTIPFDPTDRITLQDRRGEFARPMPDVMYQPISAGKRRSR